MQQQVIFARMREAFSPGFLPFDLEPNEMLPVDAPETLLKDDREYTLMKRDCIGIYSFAVPREKCTIIIRMMKSKFDIGQIVRRKSSRSCVFRIYTIKWDRTNFWYQDGWGESQNLTSGAMEDDIELAGNDEIERNAWSITYYDELMEKRSRLFRDAVMDSKVNQ